MNVRAKFSCTSVTKQMGGKYNADGKYEQGVVYAYRFQAVTSGSYENKSFYASTPSGTIELQAVRDDLFEIGQEYYLDFSQAEKAG
jgi:hypothetical protein